ncbi:MAG: 50S ribosomal protein L11 methyltransferase [Gemmatimonadota bacterium]|jgi:ribosomal protein L11 methyltransferase
MTDRPPERWLVLRVACPDDPDRSALLADALVDLGGRAVWEKGGRLVTHVPEPPDPPAFLERARRELADAVAEPGGRPESVEVETEWQAQEDWAELWKRGLRARRLTDRLVVTPSWCPVDPRPDDIVITVDPGMAFGNAEHGTTRGCLRLLERAVRPGQRVLDVGCGSGILSIAAARLGAGEVTGLEADPWAVEPALENVEANGVSDRVRVEEVVVRPDGMARLGLWDGVIANLEFGALRPLVPGLAARVAEGGWLILSGVLDHEWSALLELARAHRVELRDLDSDGEWRSGLFRRP